MLQAVLFDLDGTLLDTQADFALVINRMLAEQGLPPIEPARLSSTVSAGARAMLKAGFQLTDESPELAKLLTRFLDDYELQHSEARPYPGVPELLAALENAGLPWGIVTNKPRRFSALLMPRFPSFARCGSLICPDDIDNKGKPDPTGLWKACEELGVDPKYCAYVGDHPRDIEAAHNAGMLSIAAAWGYIPQGDAPERWGASFVANDPNVLRDHLLSLLR